MKILELRNQLQQHGHRLVMAESCTAGMIAAELGQIPGISEFFCGSMVVYRNDSKSLWLGIHPCELADPEVGPVSAEVTQQLARAVLERTPEATVAGAITGHLGPNAPQGLDGMVFGAVAFAGAPERTCCERFSLTSPAPENADALPARRRRQAEAAEWMVTLLTQCLR